MIKKDSCVIILFSIHYVLKAEQLLLANRVTIDMIPVPREISSDCGMAIEFNCSDLERVGELLAGANISIARLYFRQDDSRFVEYSL